MKFTVREGLVIHDTRIVDVGGKKTEQTNSYYEGDDVDFDDVTALKHLHKLEPADKAATAFCAVRFAPVAPPVGAAMDPAAMAALIAQTVAATMAAMQTPASASVPKP
jgi:hypothetical protein